MSSGIWIVVLVAGVIVAGLAWKWLNGRSTESSVDSFRRQIDALGPAARRSTVDQVQSAAAGSEPADTDTDTDTDTGTDERGGGHGA
jgi:hypothetical protein